MTILIPQGMERSAAAASTRMSEDLFDILVCPVDKHDLRLENTSLICIECHRTFQINEGIPDMLVEDSAPA